VVLVGTKERFQRCNRQPGEVSLGRFHAAVETETAEDCAKAVKTLFSDPKARAKQVENGYAFAERMHGPRGGVAAKLITDFIRSKLGDGESKSESRPVVSPKPHRTNRGRHGV
jgi:hypothetical protein